MDIGELEAIRAYDSAKASVDEAIPFEKAIEEIERAMSYAVFILRRVQKELDGDVYR